MKATDFDETELEEETKMSSWTSNASGSSSFSLSTRFTISSVFKQEDARLARAVVDTQNTPAANKEDIHAVVG